MTHGARQDLTEILGAIREVETNLDRRDARGYGAVLVMWGVVSAACFLYAYSAVWFPAHHEHHSAAFMTWFWTLPVGVAAVVTLFVGARRWRVREETRRDARIWWLLAALVVPVTATAAFLLRSMWWNVAATWVAWSGIYFLARGWRDEGAVRVARQAMSVGFLGIALAIVLVKPTWAYLAAAIALGLGLAGLGLLKYVRGE